MGDSVTLSYLQPIRTSREHCGHLGRKIHPPRGPGIYRPSETSSLQLSGLSGSGKRSDGSPRRRQVISGETVRTLQGREGYENLATASSTLLTLPPLPRLCRWSETEAGSAGTCCDGPPQLGVASGAKATPREAQGLQGPERSCYLHCVYLDPTKGLRAEAS